MMTGQCLTVAEILHCNDGTLILWCCRILLFEEKSKQDKAKATGPPPKRTMDELLA